MWAYGGSSRITYVSEELKDPQRDVAPAIVYSLMIVLVAYVTCNMSYFATLTSSEIIDTSVVATETAKLVVCTAGAAAVSVFISISVLGTLFNGLLATARFGYATARDGQFPAFMARLSTTQQTPYVSVLIQGALSALFLALPGSSIRSMLSFTKPVESIYEMLGVAALVRLRWVAARKREEKGADAWDAGAFKMPVYPLPLVVVVAANMYMCVNSLIQAPVKGVLGFVFVSVAFPLQYFLVRPRMRRKLELELGAVGKRAPGGGGDAAAVAEAPAGEEANGGEPKKADEGEAKMEDIAL